MDTMLSNQSFQPSSACNPPTLRGVLERLDITPLTADFVATYKREKLDEITCQLRGDSVREITKDEFSDWERAELHEMCKSSLRSDRRVSRVWHRLRKKSLLELPGDAPVIRFWCRSRDLRFYTCLRWVRVPLKEVRDVPEFVMAKVKEIADLLPDANFTVEQLRSERKPYDPFLIVSYADESYYVEVWEEPEFERKHT
jgi:hypothetical protein